MVNVFTTLFGLNWGWGEENNTMTVLISLFINSIQKKGGGREKKRIRSYKNKLNAIWKPTNTNTFHKHIGNRNLFKFASWNLIIQKLKCKGKTFRFVHMGLLAGGGALLSKNSDGVQSHGMWGGFHEHWILADAMLIKSYTHWESPRKLAV